MASVETAKATGSYVDRDLGGLNGRGDELGLDVNLFCSAEHLEEWRRRPAVRAGRC